MRSLALLLAVAANASAANDRGEELFVRTIRPLLQSKCLACHGEKPGDLKGGLDLRTEASSRRGGDSGKASLVAGKPEESPLWLASRRDHADWTAMPPKENDKLTAEQLGVLKEWITAGASWPSEARAAEIAKANAARWTASDGVRVKTSGGLAAEWTQRRYKPADIWAYQPLKKPTPPGAGHPIDALLAVKSPGPLADRRTLIRRVSFDLLGLPPTPEEIDAFLADAASDEVAFAKLVDRLLASPHYGEQMARRWLDVVRYADSAGLANDYERGTAWRYRDYVVRSFNADKPYSQFIREQLAGDEIDAANPEYLVAVGFLRMGPWELTGMEVAKVARQRFLDDVTDTVGQVFLGHMLQCARCHDHKFDPIPTRDYYAFQAAFATTQIADRPAAFTRDENVRGFEEKMYLEARRTRHQQELGEVNQREAAGRAKWQAANPDKKGQKPPKDEFLAPADLGIERIARKGLERLAWEFDRYEPIALSVYSGHTPQVKAYYAPPRLPRKRTDGELEQVAILGGGDPFRPTTIVPPSVLSAVPGGAEIPGTISGRRLALAEWIASRDNPLTPRVMANRLWAWSFGRGIAANPNNFGATGGKPTHPELLDWLAAEFLEHGGSVKHLQRRIVTSAAYRRADSSASDDTYSHFRPRRLTAEEIRDATLRVTGELNATLGGIPIRPEMNPDAALQPRQVMGTFAPAWEPSPRPEQRHRRSLYALQIRGLRDPALEIFNQPSPDLSCEKREASIVAPQALSLFNGPASHARAVALAVRVRKETQSETAAIDRVFRLCFGRTPNDAERAACVTHWHAMAERHRTLTIPKPTRPTSIERLAVEENTGTKFTFTAILPSAKDFVADTHISDVDVAARGLAEVCLVLLNANEFVYLNSPQAGKP